MTPTPKMLSPLVKEWSKNAFVVSFKLETDVNIIARKSREALQKYNHQVRDGSKVIGYPGPDRGAKSFFGKSYGAGTFFVRN